MTHSIDSRPTPWKTVLLLCGKCARKLDGGFGQKGKDTLRAALRAEIRERGHGRDVRIVETRCMGLCPKKAVTALNASCPQRILTIPRRTDAADALAQLGVTEDGPQRL